MNAALKREFFVLKNNLFFLIYVAIFMVVAVLENCIDNEGTLFFTMLTILIGCLYSTNTSTNETRYKFDKQVAALPIIPNHIVISKYIVSFIFSLFINVILFLIKQLLFVFHVSEQDMLPLIPFLLAFYSVCLIITGIGLIISFAFGGDKAVYFIMALFA
ncbi:MAG: ABC-2 transporter permease, partial [Acutalibacteraceae bacterium]